MIRFARRASAVAALTAAALIAAIAAPSLAQQASAYAIDPIHSTLVFKVTHGNVAPFFGRFNKITGSAKVADGNVLQELAVVVDAESIDTGNKARDEHLRNPDFFNTKEFPEISFKSTEIKKGSADKTFEAAGELTLHGTTKPITVTLKETGAGKNMQGKDVIGYETTFTVKRSEHGMSGFINKGIGDEVTLMVAFQAVKQ